MYMYLLSFGYQQTRNNNTGRNAFTNESIRKGFVRKVYLILVCQLIATLMFTMLVLFVTPVSNWIRSHPYMLYVAVTVGGVVLITLACVRNLRRKSPMNYILLGVFTLTEGFVLGAVACYKAPYAVMAALVITAIICLALTLFAMQPWVDFTTMRGFLVCTLIALLVIGVSWFFLRSNFLNYVYAAVSALLFSMYLVYDTQLMLGGRLYSIRPDEPVYAALNVYLDIVQIYLLIVNMFKSND